MKLRVARHTTDLQPVIEFYTELLGLEVLGSFKDHDGYDGVFLGLKNSDWHLEFTVSAEAPAHQPDEDDILVFYLDSEAAYDQVKEKFREKQIPELVPKNPYWATNGITYSDPDGYRVVISVRK